jgi:hypothetical protein
MARETSRLTVFGSGTADGPPLLLELDELLLELELLLLELELELLLGSPFNSKLSSR